MTYKTLKFYCNEGLVPNVKRDKNNYRHFDKKNIAWLKGLQCLRKCGMGLKEMKEYMNYCMQSSPSIPKIKVMLDQTKKSLLLKVEEIYECIDYIGNKQTFYNDVLSGKINYTSHLIGIKY